MTLCMSSISMPWKKVDLILYEMTAKANYLMVYYFIMPKATVVQRHRMTELLDENVRYTDAFVSSVREAWNILTHSLEAASFEKK